MQIVCVRPLLPSELVDGGARTLTSLLMNAPTMRSPRDRTNVTVLVKISTLVLLQQQQDGSLLRSSRSVLRLALAVRLVMLPLYSLKRLDVVGRLLLRPMAHAPDGGWGPAVRVRVTISETCVLNNPADDSHAAGEFIAGGKAAAPLARSLQFCILVPLIR